MTYKLRSLALIGVLALSANWSLDHVPVAPDPPMPYVERTVDGRQILALDERGQGRVVEAFGDLDNADRVAVFVPGASWRLDNFAKRADSMSPRRGARLLLDEVQRIDPEAKVAAIAWLGYQPPEDLNIDALRSERAMAGANELVRLTRTIPEKTGTTLICHSYGSVVCGRAAAKANVDDIVVVGAAGLDVGNVDELGTDATIWAARAPEDNMRFLPGFRIAGFGHGADPTSNDFGARRFGTGKARTHSDYYESHDETVWNLARIVLGRDGEVTDVGSDSSANR